MSYDDLTWSLGVKSLNKRSPKNLALLQPLEAPRGLTAELVARLTADITSGKLPPGSRLPTEQEMIAATGVSRTVIREAVAALRADRLVVTRQGVGAFVADHVRRPFRVDFDENSPLREVLNVMELRTGVEIEAAGLAAERASAAQIKKIAERFAAIQRGHRPRRKCRRPGLRLPLRDRRRHRQSAIQALPRISRPLHHSAPHRVGPLGAADQSQRISKSSSASTSRSCRRSAPHAVTQARDAMQRHLLNSRDRYEKLAAEIGIK